MIIRTAHQSGRFDATAAQQAAMLAQLTARCSVAVVTEAARLRVDDLPETWRQVGTETEVLWDRDQWRSPNFGVLEIPTPPWIRGNTHESSVKITWAGLASKATPSFTLLRGGGHLPAHLFRPAQKRANDAALAGLAAALAPVIAQVQPDEVTLSFDFNRPLTSTTQRRLIEAAVAPLHIQRGLRLVAPPKATRGLRVIDGFLTTARLHDVAMLARMPGLDHRGARMRTCADCEAKP